jgi:hypothetical protein
LRFDLETNQKPNSSCVKLIQSRFLTVQPKSFITETEATLGGGAPLGSANRLYDMDMRFFWMDVMQEKHQYSMCVTLRAQV